MSIRSILLYNLFIFLSDLSFSQQTLIYDSPGYDYNKAIQLYRDIKYSAAEQIFDKVGTSLADAQTTNAQSDIKINCDYYASVCAMNLNHEDAERRMTAFITRHPQSPLSYHVYFMLGNYSYRKHRYKDAIKWYNKVNLAHLKTNEKQELFFKRGYSNLSSGREDAAKYDFGEVDDSVSPLYASAGYYYGYIAYHKKNYQTAINSFLKIQNDVHYKSLVPAYIAQLYYLQGDYKKAAWYCVPLIDSLKTGAGELIKIAAESFYRLHDYGQAVTYFEKYSNGATNLPPQDAYEVGYSYYSGKRFRVAIPWLQQASGNNDSLSQNALYYLGSAYLNTGDKVFASNAFNDASKMVFNNEIREDALFNYAKLCYETSSDPFATAIDALNTYISTYPASPRRDEAYQYLVNIYLGTRNYHAALESLSKIKEWGPKLQAAYQKLTYYLGDDFFNNKQYDSALLYFKKSLKYDFDQKLRLNAYFWIAETHYREKRYENAINAYSDFMGQPQAFSSSEYNMSLYGEGYACFEIKDYDNSSIWFRKYISAEREDKLRLCDAYNRLGDGYFTQGNYSTAIPYYDKTLEINILDADYACFQKALALGLIHDIKNKIITLEFLLGTYPKSNYHIPAMMELANSYVIDNQNTLALAEYRQLVNEYPNSVYTDECLLQEGMIYYNLNRYDSALNEWQRVVENNRNSPEGAVALTHIKMLYVSQGQVEKMQEYFAKEGVNLSQASLDSLNFSIVKTDMLNGDCSKIITDAGNYIQKFPSGTFSAEAHYYRADCYTKAQEYDNSNLDYMFIAGMPKSFYTEPAVLKASQMVYAKKDYASALNLYNELLAVAVGSADLKTARIGKMNCNYFLRKYNESAVAADSVMQLPYITKDVYADACFIKAKSLMEDEKYDSAAASFIKVVTLTNSEEEAESKYDIGYIQYHKGDYDACQKTVFDLVNQEPSYPFWMAKGLLLLADKYAVTHDDFEAKHTLNTVIENATDTALISLAKSKLAMMKENEKKKMLSPVKTIIPNDSTEK